MVIRHDPVGWQISGKEQPGTRRLFDYLVSTSPLITADYGVYNPNSRVGSGGLSLHAEGRAMDLRVPVTADGRRVGHALFDWVVANAAAVGLQELQFDGRIITARRWHEGVRQDSAANAIAHRDHVHFGQNWAGALGQTTWYQTAPGGIVTPIPSQPPQWQEDSMSRHLAHPFKPRMNGAVPHAFVDKRLHPKRVWFRWGAACAHDTPMNPAEPLLCRFYEFDGRPFQEAGDNPGQAIPAGEVEDLIPGDEIPGGDPRTFVVVFSDGGTFDLRWT